MAGRAPRSGARAADLTARALRECVPLREPGSTPEHIRAFTSGHVPDVEADLTTRLAARGAHPATPNPVAAVDSVRPEISVLRETVKYVGDSFWFGDHEIVARVDFPHLVGIEEPVLRSLNTSPESLRAVNNRSRDALHAFRVGQA